MESFNQSPDNTVNPTNHDFETPQRASATDIPRVYRGVS
jgi:hypothetical protein